MHLSTQWNCKAKLKYVLKQTLKWIQWIVVVLVKILFEILLTNKLKNNNWELNVIKNQTLN